MRGLRHGQVLPGRAGALELWEARYDGTGKYKDVAYAAATDADGNVVVCGRSTGEAGRYDSTTIKYSPDGRELWVNRHSNGDAFTGGAHAVVTDRDGNVYVRGISTRLDPLDRLDERMTTIKYAADGTQVWANVQESIRRRDNDGDEGALAVDTAGNVHVTVSTRSDPARGFDLLTAKYSPDGTEVWARKYDLRRAWETPRALAVDGQGNVVVTGGSSVPGGTERFLTVKYSPAGDELWARQLAGGGAGALAIDPSGSIFVTGANGPIITVLYSPQGEEIWTRRHGEAARLVAIHLDGSGGAIVAGSSDRVLSLARYSAGGSTLWLREARVDASGNMVLAGSVTDFVTASFRAAGANRFRRGHVDENGAVDISDALHLLETLFLGEGFLSCPDAADSNDSGHADLSDAVHFLAFLFLGGAVAPEPGPLLCGQRPHGGSARLRPLRGMQIHKLPGFLMKLPVAARVGTVRASGFCSVEGALCDLAPVEYAGGPEGMERFRSRSRYLLIYASLLSLGDSGW